MENKLNISFSPHIHSGDSVRKNMYGVLIALVPALIVSLLYFGLGALIVTATSVLACVFFEWAIGKFIMKKTATTICDGSAVITGILLAFNLPSNLPVWIIIIGALFAIGVCKMSFGGLGNNPFNPALAGRVFLLLSFPAQMTTFPEVGQLISYMDAETAATPLAIMKKVIHGVPGTSLGQLPDAFSLFIGSKGGGSLGEVSAAALLIGLLFMLWRKIITWHIPASILTTVFIFTGIMHIANPEIYASPVIHLLSGGLILGAVFMATDYVTSPMSRNGMLIYGVCIGLLTVIIRLFGTYPEGMSFAILIMNAFTPLINIYCKPQTFGEKGKKMKKLKSSLKNMLLVLVGITVISIGLLTYANRLTKASIDEAKMKTLNDALKEVVPSFTNNPVKECDTIFGEKNGKKTVDFIIYPAKNNNRLVGTAIEATSSGFGGELKLLVGFDTEGNIYNYTLLSHSETLGLGSRASYWFKEGHKGSIKGMNPGKKTLKVNKDGGDVDAITASTVTSRAFLNAVNKAYSAYYKGNADGTTSATQQAY
ncbi:Electron transport complex protein RnfD [termite gut metagenome]|uniref:Electron transport complex protein RnfD n=1 Tax=termite gut metagenome TaxID=433724 RepID=A0A5J4RRH2_9ZZZZ